MIRKIDHIVREDDSTLAEEELPEGWLMYVRALKEASDRGTAVKRVENVPEGFHVVCEDNSTFTVARAKPR